MNTKQLRRAGMGVLLASMALAGCTSLAPNYERPLAPVPAAWPVAGPAAEASTESTLQGALQWQDFIVDPSLQALIQAALENNRDLRQTLLNIQAARAQYGIQRADRLPGVSASATGTRQRTPADVGGTADPVTSSNYQAGVGFTSFELDLFGRVASLSEAALQTYLASEETGRAARLTLIADVAQAYITRDSALRRLDLTRQTLETRERSQFLIEQRRRTGASGALDHEEAIGLTEQARADLERIQRELSQSENALRLLVGDSHALSGLPISPVDGLLVVKEMVPGLPASLLARRPDILAAEHELKARHADIGAARAAFFPRLSLTGFLGSSSADLSNLLRGGQSAWSFSPQLTLPIFDAGRNSANLTLAEVRKDMAVARYELSIQTAFREVADALSASDTLRREEVAKQALARSSAASLALSEARYRAGVDSHLRYLDAQRGSYANQIGLIDIATQRQTALVTLFRTLGGAWSKPAGVDGAS